MKKTIIFIVLAFTAHVSLHAQFGPNYNPGPDVYTCKGGAIATMIADCELTVHEWADLFNALLDPNGQYYSLGITSSDIIDAPTAYYNCHAYAWHLTEGHSNQVWINGYGNLSNYWDVNYGCFYEVPTEAEADKIHYYAGDHSAVKSSESGKYVSKWGQGCLIKHTPIQVPNIYQSSYRTYYKKLPAITGPDVIGASCSASYSIVPPSGATGVSWLVVGGGLTPTSGSGTSFTVSRTGNLNDPAYTTIQCSFTYNSKLYTVTKAVAARISPVKAAGIVNYVTDKAQGIAIVGEQYYFQADLPSNQRPFVQAYEWYVEIDSMNWFDFTGENTQHDPIIFSEDGTYRVSLRVLDGCQWSKWVDYYIEVFDPNKPKE